MKDEIKEIIKNIIYRLDCKSPTAYDGIELSKEESNLLLDYITNLQESEAYYYGQYKDYKSRNKKAIEYLKYQISQLDFYEDTKAKMLGSMVLVLLQGDDKDEN